MGTRGLEPRTIESSGDIIIEAIKLIVVITPIKEIY